MRGKPNARLNDDHCYNVRRHHPDLLLPDHQAAEEEGQGDQIVTIGGIHGTVVTVKDQTVVIKVDDNTRIEFTKTAISTVLNKDAAKTNPNAKKKVEEKKEEAKVEDKSGEANGDDVPDNTVEFKAPEKKD